MFRCMQMECKTTEQNKVTVTVPAEIQEWPIVGVLEFEVVTLCNCLQTNPVIINLSAVKQTTTAAASV